MLKQVQHDGEALYVGHMERCPCVYILASKPFGTLYIGVTSDLIGRLWKHRNGVTRGFVDRYSVYRLVHVEFFGDMEQAIRREKQLKRWHRRWKINLIEERNPHWNDLAIAYGFEPLTEKVGRPSLRPPSP